MFATAAFIGTVAFTHSARAQNDEEPAFTVLSETDGVQIREYAPMIVAETRVNGSGERARNIGFQILADYIFGNNRPGEKIAMTSPVTQQGSGRSGEKIAMTSPVTQSDDSEGSVITFVMPFKYTMETLPSPQNDRILLRQVPARRVAAVRFSGRANVTELQKYETKLRAYLEANAIRMTSSASYAFYDAPWVPGPQRRNEVMFDIE